MDDPMYKEKRMKLEEEGRCYRTNHLTWWREELPSEEEMDEGRWNLSWHNYEVDFIVSHCCASSTQDDFSRGLFKKDYLTDYLEEIHQTTQFEKWFFGHYHYNGIVNEKEVLIYEQIIRIL